MMGLQTNLEREVWMEKIVQSLGSRLSTFRRVKTVQTWNSKSLGELKPYKQYKQYEQFKHGIQRV